MEGYTFINPYTFVPLRKEGAVRFDLTECADPVFSGEIKCTLITKTQIAVPDQLKNPNADDEVKEYDFFKLNIDGKETAAIPGSSIRGVIRSVFETLTDSCMHLNDKEDDYFHTRVNKTQCGIIERRDDGSYVLYEAERLRDKEDKGFKGNKYYTGKEVSIIGDKVEDSKSVDRKGGSLSGVYLRVNRYADGAAVSHPSAFIKKEGKGKNIDEVYIQRLKVNVDMYRGDYKEDYLKAIENMEKGEGQLPVWYWYDTETKHYYFAPSQCSRAVFVNKPRDLVERMNVQSCTSIKSACEACALFGFIGKDDCRASRVRFTDAICTTEDCYDGAYILPILSEPRLSSFEFYLDGKGSMKFGADTKGVVLAGRKFYWHDLNSGITEDDAFAKEHPKMATKMQLVKPDSRFEFSVFFDKITDARLKKLVFALDLGQNTEDSMQCHKIGHGKPVGLGSAKIVVNSIVKRSYENGVYSVKPVTEEILSGATKELFSLSPRELQAFLQRVLYAKFINTKKSDTNIDYPRIEPGGNIFDWFASKNGNRKFNSKGYIEVKQTLPKITDISQKLYGQVPEKKENNNEKRGNNNGNNRGKRY